MTIQDMMDSRDLTRAELARLSQIPESTLRDIVNGDAMLERCQAGTVYRLAQALDMTVEALLELAEPLTNAEPEPSGRRLFYECGDRLHDQFYGDQRCVLLELYQSVGAARFIRYMLADRFFEFYYEDENYPMAMFVLGLLDYLCDKLGIERIARYEPFRDESLLLPLFPLDKDGWMIDAPDLFERPIPQLLRYHVYETEETLKRF